MTDFGQNVKIERDGNKLKIEIDLTKEVGKTNSGNSRLAKTSGFQGYQKLVIDGEDYGLQVGLYKKTNGNGGSSKVVEL